MAHACVAMRDVNSPRRGTQLKKLRRRTSFWTLAGHGCFLPFFCLFHVVSVIFLIFVVRRRAGFPLAGGG